MNKTKLLTIINKARLSGYHCDNEYFKAVKPLKWDKSLEKASKRHSDDMRQNHFFEHLGSDNKSVGDRLNEINYRWITCGENIAEGYLTENDVIDGWLNSLGHCRNIMNKDFTHVGVAKSGSYWTQVFATPIFQKKENNMASNDFRYEDEIPENYEQKCPLVLVLDVSGSMYGKPIDELNKGLKEFKEDIEKDVTASARLEVSIVTFGSSVDVLQDFALLDDFTMPTLSINGSTKMVDGMKKALEILDDRKKWYKSTGQTYYRPYVVLMTDGYPDHGQDVNWLSGEIDRLYKGRHLNFWACGVDGADMKLLEKIGHDDSLVQKLKGLEFVKFFRWLSASMSVISNSKEDDELDIAPKSENKNPFQIKI
jgi:uncharacterized protein YegL